MFEKVKCWIKSKCKKGTCDKKAGDIESEFKNKTREGKNGK